jgi:three-Cys-motif partner protein
LTFCSLCVPRRLTLLGNAKVPRVQRFGGSHTGRKLDAVQRYLEAYATVMKKQRFTLNYVDGFAGSGASRATSDDEGGSLLRDDLLDVGSIIEGSPARALKVEPPFDRYVFVDADPQNLRSLEELKEEHPGRKILLQDGDANERLLRFASFIRIRENERAVVFLDPFGLSVKWKTVAELADTEKVDLWYLVPVHGMSRQIKSNGTFLSSAARIDELWGSDEWRAKAIRKAEPIEDLFGQIDDRYEKTARAEQFSDMFRDRLATAFKGGVSTRYLPLGKGRLHEFSLMFACANPSPPAAGAALRIANHILGKA